MQRIAILAILGVSLMTGCKPVINTVYLASQRYPARPASYPIQLYTDRLPECEFQELALVTARPPNELVSIEAITEWLRKAVRKMGGDAVIRLQIGNVPQSEVTSDPTKLIPGTMVANSLTGTVIRFLKDDCRK
jgi:hypothetical protein